jgi:hypothetical protein
MLAAFLSSSNAGKPSLKTLTLVLSIMLVSAVLAVYFNFINKKWRRRTVN